MPISYNCSMEQSIKEYSDALYIKALAEARQKYKDEITEANKQMAQRGLTKASVELHLEK